MNLIKDLLIIILIWSGMFFLFVGVVGLLRLPDVFTRMHATSKCDTLGTGLVLLALALVISNFVLGAKLMVMAAFIWTINPIIAHMIGKTEYQRGTSFTPGSFFKDCYDRPYPGKELIKGRRKGSYDA